MILRNKIFHKLHTARRLNLAAYVFLDVADLSENTGKFTVAVNFKVREEGDERQLGRAVTPTLFFPETLASSLSSDLIYLYFPRALPIPDRLSLRKLLAS